MRWHQKSWPVFIIALPTLTVPLPGMLATAGKVSNYSRPPVVTIVSVPNNIFPNKLARQTTNSIPRNPHCFTFDSLLIASMMPLWISLFEILNIVLPDPKMFSGIAASVLYAAAVSLVILKHF